MEVCRELSVGARQSLKCSELTSEQPVEPVIILVISRQGRSLTVIAGGYKTYKKFVSV